MKNLKARIDQRSREIKNDKDALAPKQERVRELAKLIELQGEVKIPLTIKQEIENTQFRMEFKLATLKNDFEKQACEIKIAAMEKVLDLMKKNRQ
jgi:hypothetical protein